jgi:CheY-like chemotaxis protein
LQNQLKEEGWDPLERREVAAVRSAWERIQKHFFQRMDGYDVNLKEGRGKTALLVLTSLLQPKSESDFGYRLAEKLLQRGADPNEGDPHKGHPPLLTWRHAGPLALGLLLRYGADPKGTDRKGDGLLHLLAEGARGLDSLRRLSESGLLQECDFGLRNADGLTALEHARQLQLNDPDAQQQEIVALLEQQMSLRRAQLLSSFLSSPPPLEELAAQAADWQVYGGRPIQQVKEEERHHCSRCDY